MTLSQRFAKCESGATAIEYGLLAALIGAGLIAVLGVLRGSLDTNFTNIGNELAES